VCPPMNELQSPLVGGLGEGFESGALLGQNKDPKGL
jgi:hypothetical protein